MWSISRLLTVKREGKSSLATEAQGQQLTVIHLLAGSYRQVSW